MMSQTDKIVILKWLIKGSLLVLSFWSKEALPSQPYPRWEQEPIDFIPKLSGKTGKEEKMQQWHHNYSRQAYCFACLTSSI
jgi:hypothetical protein